MLTKSKILFITAFLFYQTAHAQFEATDIDSLKNILNETKIDSVKAKVLAEIGHEYISTQPDSALYYLKEAEALSKKILYKKGEATSLNYLGRYYNSKAQYYLALDYFLKALIVTDYKDKNRATAITLYDIGQLYSSLSSIIRTTEVHTRRIYYFRKAIEAFNTLETVDIEGDIRYLEAFAHSEIGRAYMSNNPQPKLDSAEYHFHSALAIAKELHATQYIPLLYFDLANLSFIRKDYPAAINLAHQAVSLTELSGSQAFLPMMYSNLGRYHSANENYDSATFFFQKAINRHHINSDSSFFSTIYETLGKMYLKKKDYKQAIESYTSLMNFAKRRSAHLDLEVAYSNLTECYEVLGDYKNAFKYLELNSILRDSLLREETQVKMTNLLSQFEAARQQSQIELLSIETEIKDLTLERSRTIQGLTIAGLFLSAIVVSIFVYQNRLIKKSKNRQEIAFKQLDSLKSRFFANISHEFRTPLTLLLAPLEKKLKQAQTQEEKAEFSLMHRSASRLLALVNQLLDLSRLEGGTLKLNLRHTDLKKFISSITGQFASMADSKGIQFIVNIEDHIELFIDHDKLEKVVTNLLSNAFKFTPAGGTITLSTKKGDAGGLFPEGLAEITVTDTGPGIAAEHLDKIFQRFYQVDDSSTRKFEGAGIGLALTKELVELHKGTISVESEVGKGSTFTVQLPLGIYHLKADDLTIEPLSLVQQPDYVEWKSGGEKTLAAAASEETVLIIEDNTDLRQYMKSELARTYRVLEATDGEEGLQMAFENVPSLIISDLMMPKRDGLQVCEIVKNDQRTSHIPVILLTAKADIETKLQGLHTGADDYIAKPFVMEELLLRIQNLVESRKRLREKYTLQMALRPAEVKVESVDERFLKNIMEVVEAHISDSSFGVEQFARETGMSQAQLYRKLHALTEFTPNEFVRHMRLQRAADLFNQKAGNVADVAYQVGFNNLSYFAKCFKEKFGVSPSEFLNTPQ